MRTEEVLAVSNYHENLSVLRSSSFWFWTADSCLAEDENVRQLQSGAKSENHSTFR
jgi:hypothetical protein